MTEQWPRLFIAVPLPDDLKQKVGSIIVDWRQEVSFKKWVHPSDLHITLKFLGAVDPEQIAAIETEMERIAARSYPFGLQLATAGTFGQSNAPRVLWAGLQGSLEKLHALQTDVEAHISPLGYPAEKRRYSPHLTIARQYTGIGRLQSEHLECAFSTGGGSSFAWTVDRMVLYRSRLGSAPMYEPVRTVVFHAGG